MSGKFIICGGNIRPGKRDECPNRLHDYPLPDGYGEAFDVANRRLARRWSNRRCPQCGIYGWEPGRLLGDASDTRVEAS